jgi:Spy/CpxP family protein refolding chaperone
MLKFMSIIVAILLSLSFSQIVFAGHHHEQGGTCHKKMGVMLKRLNLTEEQKQKIHIIKKQYKQEKKALLDKHSGFRDKMHELIKTSPNEKEKLNELVKQKQEMVADLIKLKLKMKQGIYQTLTPSQRIDFDKIREKKGSDS